MKASREIDRESCHEVCLHAILLNFGYLLAGANPL
jgi:hypothetical protein